MTAGKESVFVGVDIGGTKVAAGLVNSNGDILSQQRVPMVSDSSAEEGLAAVLTAIDRVWPQDGAQVAGIGICAPGPLDPNTGVILNPPNLPCWRNFPLAEKIRRKHDVTVKVDNDGNAAALAETRWGAARGYKNVFYATLGTGVGSGIVFDGKIYHGRTGSAAEGGHVSIDYRGPICRCGKPGCIEAYASGTAVAQRARAKLAQGQKSSMLELAGGRVEDVTGEVIGKAFAVQDPFATELLIETVKMLALWLGNVIDLLDPDVIVIGGGAMALYKPLFADLREWVPKMALNPWSGEVPILLAKYGADSGIAGGAALCA